MVQRPQRLVYFPSAHLGCADPDLLLQEVRQVPLIDEDSIKAVSDLFRREGSRRLV